MSSRNLKIKDFRGRWNIFREIRDELGGQNGQLVGQAEFQESETEPSKLIYEEQGQLTIEGAAPLSAERRYLWEEESSGTSLQVKFDDGRPFHRINLNCTMPFDNHYCAPDLYEVSYDFRSWPVWRVEWRVLGPRKNYRVWSRFELADE